MTRSPAARRSRMMNRLADLERRLAAATIRGATPAQVTPKSSGTALRKRRRRRIPGGVPRMVSSPDRVLTGVDILGTVSVSKGIPVGSGLFRLDLSPRSFEGTRICAESQLWTRWRPISLRARLVSSGTYLIPGRMGLGWSADPNLRFPTGSGAVRRLGALIPHSTSTLAVPSQITIPSGIRNVAQQWYLCEGSSEDVDHGCLVAILLSELAGFDGKVTFQLELEYTVHFSGPNLSIPEDSDRIYADSSYASYFTDSVSDWADGKKLSLKATEGGNLVPFPGARPGVVYQLDPKAVLQYYTDSTNLKNIKFGVRIPNYYVVALAVFDNKDKAVAFAKSGDSANCLDYQSAGPRVSPNNPVWTALDLTGFLISNRSHDHHPQL